MEAEEEYANPRNLASGSLTLKDINEVKARHLRWIPFTLVYTEEEISSWGERMEWLEQQGFRVVDRELIEQPTVNNIEAVNSSLDRKSYWCEFITIPLPC